MLILLFVALGAGVVRRGVGIIPGLVFGLMRTQDATSTKPSRADVASERLATGVGELVRAEQIPTEKAPATRTAAQRWFLEQMTTD